ncbi:MAG: hypothetical protein WBA51_20150 [Erythrobacter sp.]
MAKFDEVSETMRLEWDSDPYNQEVWEFMKQIGEDLNRSLRGLAEKAEAGTVLAAICLGEILFCGLHGASPDKSEAIRWTRYAAQGGSIAGSFQLAEYLEKTQNFSEAESEYIILADRGYSPAMYRLARIYWSDSSNEENKIQSVRYFKKAIKSGHLHAKADFAKLKRAGTFGFWQRLGGVSDFFALLVPMAIMRYQYPDGDLLRR